MLRVTPRGLVTAPVLDHGTAGRLYGSGAGGILEVVSSRGGSSFFLRADDGAVRPLLKIAGNVAVATWGEHGFATVVDDRVLVWNAHTSELKQIVRSSLVRDAVDLTMIDAERVVLTTTKAVVLVADDATAILVGARARARYHDSTLHLLDEDACVSWSVAGVDALARSDHAR